MAMTIDGSILLSISTTNTPRLWQTGSGKMVQELPPVPSPLPRGLRCPTLMKHAVVPQHTSRITSVAISANDSHWAIGDVDGTIKMWPLPKLDIPSATTLKHSQQNPADRKLHADFGVQAHNGPATALAFLPVPHAVCLRVCDADLGADVVCVGGAR